jgi:hypothetical protein
MMPASAPEKGVFVGNPNDRANWETLGATMPVVGVR